MPPGHPFETIEDHGDWLFRRASRGEGRTSLARESFHGGVVALLDFVEGWPLGVMTQLVGFHEGGWLFLRMTSSITVPGALARTFATEVLPQADPSRSIRS